MLFTTSLPQERETRTSHCLTAPPPGDRVQPLELFYSCACRGTGESGLSGRQAPSAPCGKGSSALFAHSFQYSSPVSVTVLLLPL